MTLLDLIWLALAGTFAAGVLITFAILWVSR